MEESFRKRVENTVGKGEIARYEQFLLFPQCFQEACNADTLKQGLVWERVKINQSCDSHLKEVNLEESVYGTCYSNSVGNDLHVVG